MEQDGEGRLRYGCRGVVDNIVQLRVPGVSTVDPGGSLC